jgi:hypothetical protein
MDFVLVIYYRREMLLCGNLLVRNECFLQKLLTFRKEPQMTVAFVVLDLLFG